MSTLLICNAQIVNEGRIHQADVFIRDGLIAQIAPDLNHLRSDHFIDASGLYLFPGMIDSRFSVYEDVLTAEALATECRAAVAGGITSVLLMPKPDHEQQDNNAVLYDDAEDGFGSSLVTNLAYYQAIQHDDLENIAGFDDQHCCALYVSMAATEDAYRFDDQESLKVLLESAPLPVAVHAESAPVILENEESYRQIYGDDIPFALHHSIRSQEACATGAKEVLEVAAETQARLHLLHVSSAEEVELLEQYRADNPNISADVCSQFLVFSDTDCEKKGAQLKFNPSIKTDIDRAALIQAVLEGTIDNVCSGHIPVSFADKQKDYLEVPPGMPQAQFVMPSVLEHYQDQILSLECIAERTSHAVAERFKILDRGYIREGYWADLVLVDIDRSFIARDEDVLSAAGWTIFNGNEFRSSIHSTIINGQVVWANGDLVEAPDSGRWLSFDRSSKS